MPYHILQGPSTSYARDFLGGLTESNVREAQVRYHQGGSRATKGHTPTFGRNPQRIRARDAHQAWDRAPEFSEAEREWNARTARTTREVFWRGDVAGSIAPITDSSVDLAGWAVLSDQVTFSYQRHLGQIQILAAAGIDSFTGEAFRNVHDALGFALAARECGARAVEVNFEANENGIPDPQNNPNGSFTLDDCRKTLQQAVGPQVEVRVGWNCIGATLAHRLLQQSGNKPDSLYQNELDFGAPGAEWVERTRFEVLAALSARKRSPEEEAEFQRMRIVLRTTVVAHRELWHQALDAGVSTIGICCGGTPDDVQHARDTFERWGAGVLAESSGIVWTPKASSVLEG